MHRQGLHVGLSYGLGLEICVGQVDFFNTFSAHRRNYPSRHMMTAWATCDRARTALETCDRARTVSVSDTSAVPPHGHQCQPCRPCAHNLGSPMMCAQSSCALHSCRRCTHVHPWDTSLQQNGWVYQNGCVFLHSASTLRLALRWAAAGWWPRASRLLPPSGLSWCPLCPIQQHSQPHLPWLPESPVPELSMLTKGGDDQGSVTSRTCDDSRN